MSVILRPYQEQAVSAWEKHVDTSYKGTLIVAPTGSGKSVVIAEAARRFLKKGKGKVLVLSHVQEIISQNANAIRKLAPEHSVGVCAASLKMRQCGAITIASVQTFVNQLKKWERPGLIIIDEAHMIPPQGEGRYRKILKEYSGIPVLGLTATPYRLGGGSLLENPVFESICFDIKIKSLVEQGFLAPLVSKSSAIQGHLSKIKKVAGEYSLGSIAEEMNRGEITEAAIDEVFYYASSTNRKNAVFFCSSVEHVEEVTKALKARGVKAEGIVGTTIPMLRDKYISEFKAQKINALISCEVLTTGFDAPCIDMIVLLRPTLSTSLYCQMLGRGMRIAPEKKDCLVLDYAGNLLRHGPIDQIDLKPKTPSGGSGEASYKVCPECRSISYSVVRECASCGYLFPFSGPDLSAVAADINPLSFTESPIKDHLVTGVRWLYYRKPPGSLCVIFDTIGGNFSEYLSFNNSKAIFFAKKKWKKYFDCDFTPETTEEAVQALEDGRAYLKQFSKVYVKRNKKWINVVDADEVELIEDEII